MSGNGAAGGDTPAFWMKAIENIPKPPDITSERIRELLSRALVGPVSLTADETKELAASVVFHLLEIRAEKERRLAADPKP